VPSGGITPPPPAYYHFGSYFAPFLRIVVKARWRRPICLLAGQSLFWPCKSSSAGGCTGLSAEGAIVGVVQHERHYGSVRPHDAIRDQKSEAKPFGARWDPKQKVGISQEIFSLGQLKRFRPENVPKGPVEKIILDIPFSCRLRQKFRKECKMHLQFSETLAPGSICNQYNPECNRKSLIRISSELMEQELQQSIDRRI